MSGDETRDQVIGLYRRVREHADATIDELAIDAPGQVPWWPRPNVTLFNILVHMLTETNWHAGHADILREQLDGVVGVEQSRGIQEYDADYWANHRAKVELAARAADPTSI